MAHDEWHYSTGDDHQQGPVAAIELNRLADSGELCPDDLVWKQGMEEWVPACRIKGLTFSTPTPESTAALPPTRLNAETLQSTLRDAQRKADEAAGAVWFLDLKFSRFVSATIIRVVWSVYLAFAVLGLGLATVGLILRESILQAALYFVLMVAGLVFLTLMFRVWLEALMVIFRMAEHLREMNETLASKR